MLSCDDEPPGKPVWEDGQDCFLFTRALEHAPIFQIIWRSKAGKKSKTRKGKALDAGAGVGVGPPDREGPYMDVCRPAITIFPREKENPVPTRRRAADSERDRVLPH